MSLFLFVILLLTGNAVAGEPDAPVRVGLHYSAPWAYADAEGRLQGIDYDIVRHVFDQLGVEVDIELFAYERLIQKFRNKELDYVSPMAFVVKGAHQTLNYLDIQDVAVTRAKAAIVLEQMTDLRGRAVVAYQKASEVLGEDFRSALQDTAYLEMADRERQLDLLSNNKVDVVVGDRRVLEYFSRKNYGEGKIAVHDIFPQTSYPGAFWDAELTRSFNRVLKQMREAGQLQKYYSSPRH
jgi:polar amino acid transport system substrate-binding protein